MKFYVRYKFVQKRVANPILGCSKKTAVDLQTEIARLEPFQVVARSSEKTEDFVKFNAEAFYKND